jgi:hypothetical protein
MCQLFPIPPFSLLIIHLLTQSTIYFLSTAERKLVKMQAEQQEQILNKVSMVNDDDDGMKE